MKEFIKEFKEFINPILGLFGGMNFDQYHIKLLGQVTLN